MTEVRHEPRKEVIIHEVSFYKKPEELAISQVTGAPPGSVFPPLKWVNGIVLVFSALPMNEVTTKEIIEGRIHWDHVAFAPMPKYEPTITLADKNIVLSVVDVSANETFRAIGKYLRDGLLPHLGASKRESS